MKQYRLVFLAFILLFTACKKDQFAEDFPEEDQWEDTGDETEDEEGALTLYSVNEDQIDRNRQSRCIEEAYSSNDTNLRHILVNLSNSISFAPTFIVFIFLPIIYTSNCLYLNISHSK